ncbi:MAG TPA: isoprenylcysteine carboxylmethyltransferase family protein, partial [Verrucomicrobiae bacterium]|nr:isoprenylcysteine carboxylmethyltransferase family protein [Verrucomicrobiae bacterium]
MTTISSSVILGCWFTLIVYWIISARRLKATAERQSIPSALLHRIPLGLSYFLMANWHLPPSLNRLLTPHANWAYAAGDLVCVMGLFFTIWARRTLAGNWSSNVTFKQGHELIRRGPYRLARHP